MAPSYLFGTMHTRDAAAFGWQNQLNEVIAECDAFAAEFKLDDADPEAQMAMSVLPDDKTWADYYRPKRLAKMVKIFKKVYGLDVRSLMHLHPMIAVSHITQLALPADKSHSLDEALWQEAMDLGKLGLGVETYDEQLATMAAFDVKDQFSFLYGMSRNPSKFKAKMLKLTQHYVEQNIQQLYKSSKKSAGKLRSSLLYDRNVIMAERIKPMIEEQSTFVAIGAGHLSGKLGVLKLLKDRGVKVKPVKLV